MTKEESRGNEDYHNWEVNVVRLQIKQPFEAEETNAFLLRTEDNKEARREKIFRSRSFKNM